MELPQLGRLLIVVGAFLLVAGITFSLLSGRREAGSDPTAAATDEGSPPVVRDSWRGLPGDIYVRREGYSFYFPLGTCIVISLVLTLLFRVLGGR